MRAEKHKEKLEETKQDIRRCERNQKNDVQIDLSLVCQGEWNIAPGNEEFKITKDKFLFIR